jgi:hypothetical protein
MSEAEQSELLENILTAEVLTLAHLLKTQQTVMDESINPTDFHAEAVAEIKRSRAEIITRLTSG